MDITDEIGSGNFDNYVSTHPLYMHEYGHTIDSRSYGPAYLFAIGIPSLISVSNNAPVPGKIAWSHDYKPYEMRANRNAVKYFGKYYGVSWSNPYLLYDIETYFPTHL